MSYDWAGLITKVTDHALTLGVFESVNGHEPKSAPGKGLTAAVWVQDLSPIQASGLSSTSVRVELNVRIYTSMLSEPQDAIDPAVLVAADTLMAAYSADFDLNAPNVRMVDLLGAYGVPLKAAAGYINQDNRLYRVMTVTLPIILNDQWGQNA